MISQRTLRTALSAIGAGAAIKLAASVSEKVLRVALERNPLKERPVCDENAPSQQAEAARFHNLGLVPVAIGPRKEIWHANT